MGERFERLESYDTWKSRGDEYTASAWRDHGRHGEVRYLPVGVNPNEDDHYLNS